MQILARCGFAFVDDLRNLVAIKLKYVGQQDGGGFIGPDTLEQMAKCGLTFGLGFHQKFQRSFGRRSVLRVL